MKAGLLFRSMVALHRGLYRLSGGRIGGRLGTAPVLLLTTVGRSTGIERTIPLTYVRHSDAYALAASFRGSPRHPAWYLNLMANPQTSVQVGPRKLKVTASTADPELRAELWPKLVAMYAGYEAISSAPSVRFPSCCWSPKTTAQVGRRRVGQTTPCL